MTPSGPFRRDADRRRFELPFAAGEAFADYRVEGGDGQAEVLAIVHVEADQALRGSGAAGLFMEALVAHAREAGLRLRALCPYAVAWLERHPEARDRFV